MLFEEIVDDEGRKMKASRRAITIAHFEHLVHK